MTLTPLDRYDPRLRQVCASLTKTQLRAREQQLEIEALLGFVHGVVNKERHGSQRDTAKPTTVGLAGNQVGIMKQICAVDLSIGHQGYTDIHVLINPRIIAWSKSVIVKPESCVNFPGIWGLTHRSRSVTVESEDRSGNKLRLKLSGWPAVLLQHEIDHLNGHLFIDRLPDPTKAHLVVGDDYVFYKRVRPEKWTKFVDVSIQAVRLSETYQAFGIRTVE